jgi:hypothetical protein
MKYCKHYKAYKGKIKPTCGCDYCANKYKTESAKRSRVTVESIEIIPLSKEHQKLADEIFKALRKYEKNK